MKLIADEEYIKLFDLAVQDYNQAIALDPDNAEMYYRRGNAYYSRAGLDMIYDPTRLFFSLRPKLIFPEQWKRIPKMPWPSTCSA